MLPGKHCATCEPVAMPREMEQYLLYFCGDANDPEALLNAPSRCASRSTSQQPHFLRAYAAIAQNLEDAGYSAADIAALEKEIRVL